MAKFISDGGQWSPGKEHIGLTNLSDKPIKYDGKTYEPGEPFIYIGPDREAVKMLNEAGEEKLGHYFKNDPEFLQAVRNIGFQNADEYLAQIGYDEEKAKEEFNKKASVVNKHELPKKAKEIIIMGGGKDTSGSKDNDVIGGFGEVKVRKPSDVKAKV